MATFITLHLSHLQQLFPKVTLDNYRGVPELIRKKLNKVLPEGQQLQLGEVSIKLKDDGYFKISAERMSGQELLRYLSNGETV